MNNTVPNDLLMRFLQATPDQQAVIERVLAGQLPVAPPKNPTGPWLISMGASAKLLGVSRGTLWRMIKAGRLDKIEVLPGSFRLRRADLEAIVAENP